MNSNQVDRYIPNICQLTLCQFCVINSMSVYKTNWGRNPWHPSSRLSLVKSVRTFEKPAILPHNVHKLKYGFQIWLCGTSYDNIGLCFYGWHRIMMVLMPEMYRRDEGYRIAVTKAKTSYLDFKAVWKRIFFWNHSNSNVAWFREFDRNR